MLAVAVATQSAGNCYALFRCRGTALAVFPILAVSITISIMTVFPIFAVVVIMSITGDRKNICNRRVIENTA